MTFQTKHFSAMSQIELENALNVWLDGQNSATIAGMDYWSAEANGRMHYFAVVTYRS